ncbi:hypothetical protein [Leptolyngbya sp. FACHB-261]|uniref:hypothetical protein n=1 Tax=Leptolyngbya sp. FACHB-261 TaxID=2692806 RepID=UPI00168890AB|nr:hypothetical protein [Leptolyngbya sp. FACHB-261]MBD2100429.1 hypothetical protein [Leptolyngbya sp. FACHB-261]
MFTFSTFARIVKFLDSDQTLAWIISKGTLATNAVAVGLVVKGLALHTGLPLSMTAIPLIIYTCRYRYESRRRLPTARSQISGVLVWGCLAGQSLIFSGGIL